MAALIEALLPGDTLVVWRLDRLGRSLRYLIDTVAELDGLRSARSPRGSGLGGPRCTGRCRRPPVRWGRRCDHGRTVSVRWWGVGGWRRAAPAWA
ncbi:MAG: recombinase family protein [Cellulomonas sp.]|nr:recombinase family protein [Cellulomonas sp.]